MVIASWGGIKAMATAGRKTIQKVWLKIPFASEIYDDDFPIPLLHLTSLGHPPKEEEQEEEEEEDDEEEEEEEEE